MGELDNLIPNKNQFKILIVDDKANMRRTLRNMLRVLGFANFREAEDGDVAVQRMKAEKFDFIICDWNMPRMSGVDVLRVTRSDERFKDLPFLMVTAEVEESTVAEVLEADVDGYVIKPFLPKTLEDKMVDILSKRQAPSALDTHLQLADVLIKAKNFAQAHQELDKAAKINQRSPRVHYYRGLTYEAQGDLEKAEKALTLAREVGPKFIKAHEKLAEILERKGKKSQMLEVLKEVVRISPRNADRQTKLGQALLADGRIQDAKTAFKTAVTLDPSNPDRKTTIGESYLSHGLAQEAEDSFKASIEVNPEDIYVYNRLGIAFRRQKKFDEAIEYYKRALAINANEENLLYNLARAYLGAGKTDPAVAVLKRALNLQPDFEEARILLNKIQKK